MIVLRPATLAERIENATGLAIAALYSAAIWLLIAAYVWRFVA